ncbi:MAG: DUF411 domain-containing protein [Vicinamibacterales bacterium]
MTFRAIPRVVLCLVIAGASISAAQRPPAAARAAVEGKVYLTPTCGCCGKWVEHMNASGFKLTREVTSDMSTVAAHRKVPESLHSCHTAVIGQYVIEGHVPADLIKKLLQEQPKIVGLSAPGMPAGSPGMDVPNSPSYPIVAFRADGTTYEFARR